MAIWLCRSKAGIFSRLRRSHLSTMHEDGNLARVYVADGTVLGNVNWFSGYTNGLDEPTCAYLTDTYLGVGNSCDGTVDATSMSVSHHLGKILAIWMIDITMHGRPRTDNNIWALLQGEVLLGLKEGCIA